MVLNLDPVSGLCGGLKDNGGWSDQEMETCGPGCYQDGDGGVGEWGGFRDRISPLKQNMSPASLLKNKPVSISGAGVEKHRTTVFTGTR